VNQDDEHLRLLSVFHYVVGGLGAVFSLFPVLHLIIGLAMVTGRIGQDNQDQFPRVFGWFFVVIALFVILCGLTYSGLLIWAGRCIAWRRHYSFCFVMAAVSCIFFPFGTVLGVFTLLVLNRPSVREQFLAGPHRRLDPGRA
jgi:hypothetical protein